LPSISGPNFSNASLPKSTFGLRKYGIYIPP
jgi:hypothetical protein